MSLNNLSPVNLTIDPSMSVDALIRALSQSFSRPSETQITLTTRRKLVVNDDGSNWILVRDQLKRTLDVNRVGLHIHQDFPGPPQPIYRQGKWFSSDDVQLSNPLSQEQIYELDKPYSEWACREATAIDLIKDSVSEEVFQTIFFNDKGVKQTAYSIWQSLNQLMLEKNRLHTPYLWTQLRNPGVCEEGANLREHIAKLLRLRSRNTLTGETVPDSTFMNAICRSLPFSYHSFITSLRTVSRMAEETLDSSALMKSVLNEFDRRSIWERHDPRAALRAQAGYQDANGPSSRPNSSRNVSQRRRKRRGNTTPSVPEGI